LNLFIITIKRASQRKQLSVSAATSATRFSPGYARDPFINQSRCTPDPGIDPDGFHGTVDGACAAFDTGVEIYYFRLGALQNENLMGANRDTHPAANADFTAKLKSSNIWQVGKPLHDWQLLPCSDKTGSNPEENTCKQRYGH
jgi:hypothetical protein